MRSGLGLCTIIAVAGIASLGVAVLGCASGGGAPLEGIALGTGLVVTAAPECEETPELVVLAERTSDERGYRRAAIYSVTGRFAHVRTAAGEDVCGPGIAGLFLVQLDGKRVERVIRFGDPGAGEEAPVLCAKAVREPGEYDETTRALLEPLRPARVVITVSGIFSGVAAGNGGSIADGLATGAIVCLDLYNPRLANALAFRAGDDVSAIAFDEPVAATDGLRATVTGQGPFAGASDLLGFSRSTGGDSLHARLDLLSGAVESLDTLSGPAM